VIALSSISKSHAAPGFRSGWAVGPHEFCERLLPLSETMLFGNQPFIADMTAFALNSDICKPRRGCGTDYKRRSKPVRRHGLGKLPGRDYRLSPAGGNVHHPRCFRDRAGRRGASPGACLRPACAVMPGSSFGENAGNLVRLSLTVPDEIGFESLRSHRTHSWRRL
jgi:arginine:pyruvate transaminase